MKYNVGDIIRLKEQKPRRACSFKIVGFDSEGYYYKFIDYYTFLGDKTHYTSEKDIDNFLKLDDYVLERPFAKIKKVLEQL